MAIRDLEAFIRQKATSFNPNLDVSAGSPFDVQVIQPLVRRLGVDPFTVDITTFINERLVQAFPELATKEGDTLTDLLNKPVSLLWDPVVREIRRIQRSLSFRDPSTLTLDEADALGANLFTNRRKGDFSRGGARICFNQPQNVSISPVNFVTSRSGLHFFPIETQSIRTEEMILNVDDEGLYFFDFNTIAENPGSQYNIEPNSLVSIANVPAAVRVKNLRRFRFGDDEENAVQFTGRVQQSLSERSLVTLRGIAAKLLDNFPDVNRLNVVGFGDPEMQRDIIMGGGYGEIVAMGIAGTALADAENKAFTRRFFTAEVDFIATITSEPSSWVLTIFGATGPVVHARDFPIRAVIGEHEVDLEDQLLLLATTSLRWTLRKKELTLSHIPGGILFPSNANGTVSIPDNEVHVGGMYDVHVRGTDFEDATLAINNVTDDDPLFVGSELTIAAGPVVKLGDFVLDVDYVVDDETYKTFADAGLLTFTLQILEGVDAGNYRILSVSQVSGFPVELTVDPAPNNIPSGPFRWRLFDQINIDLVEPKETRLRDDDLRTVQGADVVDTVGGINFNDFGVAEGDVLRILDGPDAGDYKLLADPLAPSFDKLQVDQPMTQSRSNLEYVIFRANDTGGLQRPLVRINTVELLDSSNQPIGSTIPYAKPVDIQSRAFQNPARGIKHDIRDAILGLVSVKTTAGSFPALANKTLDFLIEGVVHTVTFPGVFTPTLANTIAEISAQLLSGTSMPQLAVQVGSDRLGMRPVRGGVQLVGGTAHGDVFGLNTVSLKAPISTFDIRSVDIEEEGGFATLDPAIDLVTGLDVVQVLDGNNIGFYNAPYTVNENISGTFPTVPGNSDALKISPQEDFKNGFAPEVVRHVQIGARSLGSVRLFFLEPTSFEVDVRSRFILTTDTGVLRFLPDPTLDYQRIPAQPGGSVPKDGSSATAGITLTSASQDFVRSGIQPGDRLVIENIPISGTTVLPDPIPECVNKTFIFSLDGGPDRTLTFIRDDVSLNVDEVSRQGVVDAINSAMGENVCVLTGASTLEFETTRSLVIREAGTANGPNGGFPGLLGLVAGTGGSQSFITDDQNNESPHAGDYDIIDVRATELDVDAAFPSAAPYTSPLTRQTFRVFRNGLQRITTTAMADNKAEASLFFFDVELVSEGSGDEYNIAASQQLQVEGFRSDGYFLTTDDDNLTFSSVESVKLVLSRTILEQGVDDDPANATQVSGQNIQVTYERAPLVEDVQGFISSDVERVVCANPLSRHLIPHFVRFDLRYTGGSRESVVVPEVEKLIRDLFPIDPLESSDIQKVVLDRGAVSIDNPIDIIAVVHYADRTVYIVRSQNAISTGRLSAFIPDVLNITRNTT
jgi:hypothetical protein